MTEDEFKNKFAKATVTFLKGKQARDSGDKTGGEVVPVMFNPSEYSHEIANTFAETKIPGLPGPTLGYVNGEAQTLSMELLLDSWTDGAGAMDVVWYVRKFREAMAIDASLHAPPLVEFAWGREKFKAVITSLSQSFTMFHADGRPARAKLKVTFKHYQSIDELLNTAKGESTDKTKQRVFIAGDSLWAMAAREYHDPAEWRRIARYNRIRNPRSIASGTLLVLPPLEEAS